MDKSDSTTFTRGILLNNLRCFETKARGFLYLKINKIFMQYFSEEEFIMGRKNVYNKMDSEFLLMLDDLIDRVGQPLNLSSSYRSKKYNKLVGGAKKSYHLKGRAVDIICPDSATRAKICSVALTMGLTCGVNEMFIHIDNRDEQILFLY